MLPALYPHLTWADFFAFLNIFKRSKKEFIQGLTEKFRSKHALTFSSGRAGLFSILKAHGIEDKSVLITAYTCCVVTEAIVQSKNKPVFIDLENGSFNAKVTQDLIQSRAGNLAAVVVTNLYGIAHYSELKELQRKQNVLLILDDALSPAHVAQRQRDLYDYAIISCGVRKPFSCLGGGVVFTDDDKHFETLNGYVQKTRKLIRYGEKFKKIFLSFLYFIAFQPWVYGLTSFARHKTGLLNGFFNERHNDIHKNCPDYYEDMQPFQKRLGLKQLKKIDRLLEKRRQIGDVYFRLLSEKYAWVKQYWALHTPYSHMPFLHEKRDRLHSYLLKNKIETEKYFDYVVPEIDQYNDNGQFPNASRIAQRMINLPINPGMNEDAVKRVVDVISKFERENHE